MKEIGGWWFPDEEAHIPEYFKAIDANEYQPVHQKTVLQHCDKFRTAVDIGAHVGLWSRGLSQKFDLVVAFEPCDEFADIHMKNAPDVGMVHRCALGEQQGFVKLNIRPDNTGSTHVDRGATGTIPVFPLDHFHLDNVDLIKIDVEGYELEVIKGGFNTFKRNNPVVIVEQKDRYVVPEQGHHAAVRFLMRELNYRVIGRVVDDWILKKL